MIRKLSEDISKKEFRCWKRIFPGKDDPGNKFKPNYEDSYLVYDLLSNGVLILSKMDVDVLFEPFNFDFMKRYLV